MEQKKKTKNICLCQDLDGQLWFANQMDSQETSTWKKRSTCLALNSGSDCKIDSYPILDSDYRRFL